jgi:hypothetical protein
VRLCLGGNYVWRRAAAAGAPLRLAVSEPAVRYLFTITGAALLIDMHPTVAAALVGD